MNGLKEINMKCVILFIIIQLIFEQNHSNINTFSSYNYFYIVICLAIIIYNFRYSTKEIIAYSFDINYYIFCKNILNNIFNLMLKIITNNITF